MNNQNNSAKRKNFILAPIVASIYLILAMPTWEMGFARVMPLLVGMLGIIIFMFINKKNVAFVIAVGFLAIQGIVENSSYFNLRALLLNVVPMIFLTVMAAAFSLNDLVKKDFGKLQAVSRKLFFLPGLLLSIDATVIFINISGLDILSGYGIDGLAWNFLHTFANYFSFWFNEVIFFPITIILVGLWIVDPRSFGSKV